MMGRLSRWVAVLLLGLPAAAQGDVRDTLGLYELEVRRIQDTMPRLGTPAAEFQHRRLVQAQTDFTLGRYDQASLALLDLAAAPGPDQEAARYYLAETLYRKGDRGAARTYFNEVVTNHGSGKYARPSRVRLIEIGIALDDMTDADAHLSALGTGDPEATYVRGKHAFAQGNADLAISLMGQVPESSVHGLQALYFAGTAHVAKKDLDRATEIFNDLVTRRPKTTADRRVIELSQLALGRVYYERAQPTKAIDAYLLVDRHSDLFADALYEVAWVYVKGKQFDKALRALELLSLSTPNSKKTATVRILEGNLRIRKAQLLREAQIVGTADVDLQQDPAVEYDKATQIFADAHAAFFPSFQALEVMVASQSDPADYLAQLAGRHDHVFQAMPPIPEEASRYLREEPDVGRAVANQVDLETIETHLEEAEATIARLEAVIGANDPTIVYPAFASRRSRLGTIQHELIKIRVDLAEQQLPLVSSDGALSQATAARRALAQQYMGQPDPESAAEARAAERFARQQGIEASVTDSEAALDSSLAMAVALRTQLFDPSAAKQPLTDEQKTTITAELEATQTEAVAIKKEIDESRAELAVVRDLGDGGDPAIAQGRELRRQLVAALDAEHRLLAGAAGASRNGERSRNLVTLGDRATKIAQTVGQVEQSIDTTVAQAVQQAQTDLVSHRELVATYRAELGELETESRAVGGTALAASFQKVKARFYDVIVRTDVGSIDVVWSQKEDADDDLKRLNLSRQRELKQLKDEFKDILDAAMPNPGQPRSQEQPPAAAPSSGSPDQGGGGERVKPGGEAPKTTQPTVRPDNETTQPKGGSR